MNAEKKAPMKDDGAWNAVHEAFNTEVSEHLERQLQNTLHAFRQDLREHPYVRRPERHGFSLRQTLSFFSRPWVRPLMLAGLGIACVAILVFFPFGREVPTWAEVAQSFRGASSFHATFYRRDCAWCSPYLVELWKGYGDRFRILSGHTVAFGKKDGYLKAYNLKDRVEGKPDPAIQGIILAMEPIDQTRIDFAGAILEAHSDGEVVDTTALVNPGPVFSKDIVVFDAKSKFGGLSIRLWALRESRLPVRILYRGLAGYYADVIITYSKVQPEKFFDPEAFATEMNKSYHMEHDLMYLFMEDPAESLKLSDTKN
jgi:hypothetical protein